MSNQEEINKLYRQFCRQYTVPNEYKYNPQYQVKENGMTFSMFLATKKINPPEQWYHNPKLVNNRGQTVAELLIKSKIEPSVQWVDDVNKRYEKNYTMAMKIAELKQQPPLWWYHNPCLVNDNNQTVAMILASKQIEIPKYWEHISNLKDNNGYTVSYYIISKGKLPNEEWYCDPNTIYKVEINKVKIERSAAHILASKGIIPPEKLHHDPKVQDSQGNTVQKLLESKKVQVDSFWKVEQTENNMLPISSLQDQKDSKEQLRQYLNINYIIFEILKQYCQQYNIDMNVKDEQFLQQLENQKETFAMYLISQGIYEIPQQFMHNPALQDDYGLTVAMLFANCKMVPPKEWEHKPELQDNSGYTVAMYLTYNGIVPPQQWIHDSSLQNNNGQTVAMLFAVKRMQIPQQWYHDAKIINKNGNTVASILEIIGMEIPNEFKYDSEIKLLNGRTTAIQIASRGRIPSEQWIHDPYLKDDYGNTVGILLSNNGIIPPNQWYIDVQLQNNAGQSIKSNLSKYNYIYDEQNKQFKPNVCIKQQNYVCAMCQDKQKEFIQTKCDHKICLSCYNSLNKINNKFECAICKKQDWIIPAVQDQYEEFLKSVK